MDPRGINLWEEQPEPLSSVAEFYRNKVILLTGATGFFGKLYMNKLIECEVAELIIVVREKKGVGASERIQKLWETEPALKRFRDNVNNCQQRITIIEGDLEKDGLAMSEEHRKYLTERTQIVLHGAADVRFDDTLVKSVLSNVKGTHELLKLCLDIRNLQLLMYISTAYANWHTGTHRLESYERFYETPIDPLVMIKFAENFDPEQIEQLNAVTSNIIAPWPNPYTFSKALAESLVRKFYHRMNIAIIRPSIVISSMHQPLPGWTDNLYGLNGLLVGIGAGVVRAYHTAAEDIIIDAIPGDFCINGSLVAGKYTAERCAAEPPSDEPDKVAIFHINTGTLNPLYFSKIANLIMTTGRRYPPLKSFAIPSFLESRFGFMVRIYIILLHFLPGLLADAVQRRQGKKPMLMKIYRKVQLLNPLIAEFQQKTVKFNCNKMSQVVASMDEGDKEKFYCDVTSFTWDEFFESYLPGMKLYVLKEGPNTWEESIKRFNRLNVVKQTLIWLFWAMVAYLSFKLISALCPWLQQVIDVLV